MAYPGQQWNKQKQQQAVKLQIGTMINEYALRMHQQKQQQTAPQTTRHPAQQTVELQVATNTQIPSDAPPPDYGSPANDDEYATHSNQYENPQNNEKEHAYIYIKPPTDEKHEWINDDDVPPPGYDDVEPKEGLGCVRGCRETPHIKAWMCTILVLIPIVLYLVCILSLTERCYCGFEESEEMERQSRAIITDCSHTQLHCDAVCGWTYGISGFLWIIVAVVYLLYICEAICCSSSFRYLKNYAKGETVYKWVAKIKENPPVIWWRVECYHYETKHYKDSNGKRQTRREKVTTHIAAQLYAYSSWADISKDVSGLDEYELTKFTAYKQFGFADKATKNDYNMKSAQFRMANDRDVYQSFYYGVEIDGFKSKILFEVKEGTKSSLVSLSAYVLSSIFLCSAPYRMYFAAICGRKSFVFDKQVKTAPQRIVVVPRVKKAAPRQVVVVQPQPRVVIIQRQQPNTVVVQPQRETTLAVT